MLGWGSRGQLYAKSLTMLPICFISASAHKLGGSFAYKMMLLMVDYKSARNCSQPR